MILRRLTIVCQSGFNNNLYSNWGGHIVSISFIYVFFDIPQLSCGLVKLQRTPSLIPHSLGARGLPFVSWSCTRVVVNSPWRFFSDGKWIFTSRTNIDFSMYFIGLKIHPYPMKPPTKSLVVRCLCPFYPPFNDPILL